MTTIDKHFGLRWPDLASPSVYPYQDMRFSNLDLLVGLEFEIEGFPDGVDAGQLSYCCLTDDGSLRNGGVEVVTFPHRIRHTPSIAEHVFSTLEVNETNYSERCSIHVHVNVLDFTIDQLKSLCLVYSTVERLLFKFVGNNRENNIFCVPWYQAGVADQYISDIDANIGRVRDWQKYTSLNLQPVQSQGTVEFRHMYGTCDLQVIKNWLRLICDLVEYSRKVTYEEIVDTICKLNTVSNYEAFLRTVFPTSIQLLTQITGYRDELAHGVIDSKLMLTKPVKQAKTADWQEELTQAAFAAGARILRQDVVRTIYADPSITTTTTAAPTLSHLDDWPNPFPPTTQA